jgi:hypothetical protein
VACVVPSGRVMVLSVPVTPDPAVTGPVTGGQKVAHDPVHLEVVEVSGANQYSVLPLELVTTAVPLMVVMFTVLPLALDALLPPAAGAVVAGVLDDELAELPQADSARARAANPAALNIFRIRILLFTVLVVSHGESRTSQPFSSRSVQLVSCGGNSSWSRIT